MAKKRGKPSKSELPDTLYVKFHDDGDSSWYECQKDIQDFSEEGYVATYTMAGPQGHMIIKNILQEE